MCSALVSPVHKSLGMGISWLKSTMLVKAGLHSLVLSLSGSLVGCPPPHLHCRSAVLFLPMWLPCVHIWCQQRCLKGSPPHPKMSMPSVLSLGASNTSKTQGPRWFWVLCKNKEEGILPNSRQHPVTRGLGRKYTSV